MLDELDRGLIHALHIDARAPFSRIGHALGVSTQTAARRFQRLRADAGVRVVGLAKPELAGRAQWLVRLAVSPNAVHDVAYALGRRADTLWVNQLSSGTEVVAIVQVPANAVHGDALLTQDIPRTPGVTAVWAHRLLHTYLGSPTVWRGSARALDDHQRRSLLPPWRDTAAAQPARRVLTDTDGTLLGALRYDGRASYAELATATGWSATTVARRLTTLRATGSVFFEVEVDPALFGITTKTLLWIEVAPARLDEVATAMARHEELTFVAATTGRTNLVAHALCTDPAALHRYLTQRLGKLEGIRTFESTPVLRTVKGAGPSGPAPAPRRFSPAGRIRLAT